MSRLHLEIMTYCGKLHWRFGDSSQGVKFELNLEVVVHTGLVSEKAAQTLAEAQIDSAIALSFQFLS